MAGLNLEHLLKDISTDSPCGENLEEDPLFLQLENEAKFVEERQMGDSIIPAEEPDWKVVRKLALQLLERTCDVQIVMHLICALVRTDGFAGLEQGLGVIKGWLQNHWDDVYPLQDPEDDYPILRLNTLTSLNDYKLILNPINHLPLTQSSLGNYCWRDQEVADGKITVSADEEQPEKSIIDAAFTDTDFTVLKTLEGSVNHALTLVQEIFAIIADKAGTINAPDFSSLTSLLQNIDGLLSGKIQSRPENDTDEQEEEGIGEAEISAGQSGLASKPVNKHGIHSRDDVVRALDEVCKYFERYEPTSPVPLLLLRAKKLLTMNFIDILYELAPDAVQQAENICGKQNTEE